MMWGFRKNMASEQSEIEAMQANWNRTEALLEVSREMIEDMKSLTANAKHANNNGDGTTYANITRKIDGIIHAYNIVDRQINTLREEKHQRWPHLVR